jgi:hypothetical protein
VRELIGEALAFRRVGRPDKPPVGKPFHIDI